MADDLVPTAEAMMKSRSASSAGAAVWGRPRGLTRAKARMEQRIFWSGKSVAERLAAATELTRRMYRMRGIDLDERKADFTPHRVRRGRG